MPSLVVSQSYGKDIVNKQGIEVRYYEEQFKTLIPSLINNSSYAISENRRNIEFSTKIGKKNSYNDLDSYDFTTQSALSRLENNRTTIGRDSISKIPDHRMEQRDLGIPPLFKGDLPFQDYSSTNALGYLTMQGDGSKPFIHSVLNYPYVLELENPLDPHSYDGVIEIFAKRSFDRMQSEEKPLSSRKIKGAISNYVEDQFGFCIPIEQKIYFYNESFKIRPYLEFRDFVERFEEIKHGYFHDEIETFEPYEEKALKLKFDSILDEDISELIATSTQTSDAVGKKYISSATGYTFIDSQNGTDSIAFLDQRGY